MGIFDKLKDVANMVTGGAARVTIEFDPDVAFPGEQISVVVTATSTGSQVKSGGVFVDLRAIERVKTSSASHSSSGHSSMETNNQSHTSFDQEVRIAPPFVLPANETMRFKGTVTIPTNAQPTFTGYYAQHEWTIRGRVEAVGNDPDSGFIVFRVGSNG